MMQTGYSGANGNCPRYVCARAKQLYGGERGCQSLGGRRLEQRVLDEVFIVLAPAALAATAQALHDAEHNTPPPCGRSPWQSSGPGSKPSGPAGNTTPSNRRTASSLEPWNAPWRPNSACSAKPSGTCSLSKPAAQSSSPRTSWPG
jgi:hypothetical protein